jgi:hypothetical protein
MLQFVQSSFASLSLLILATTGALSQATNLSASNQDIPRVLAGVAIPPEAIRIQQINFNKANACGDYGTRDRGRAYGPFVAQPNEMFCGFRANATVDNATIEVWTFPRFVTPNGIDTQHVVPNNCPHEGKYWIAIEARFIDLRRVPANAAFSCTSDGWRMTDQRWSNSGGTSPLCEPGNCVGNQLICLCNHVRTVCGFCGRLNQPLTLRKKLSRSSS